MAIQTYVIRNSVDGKYDVFHWDPAVAPTVDATTHLPSTTMIHGALESNQGTGNGQKDSHRDTDRTTGEGR